MPTYLDPTDGIVERAEAPPGPGWRLVEGGGEPAPADGSTGCRRAG